MVEQKKPNCHAGLMVSLPHESSGTKLAHQTCPASAETAFILLLLQ
jgi:hypothetical protein